MFVIGVSGGSGSGKTTLVHYLQKHFGNESILILQDDYYHDLSHLPQEERNATNFDTPESVDFHLHRDRFKGESDYTHRERKFGFV